MQKNVNPRKKPLWRKIATIAALPLLIFIWTTGWILTQIGSQEEPAETRQKTCQACAEFEVYEQEIVT